MTPSELVSIIKSHRRDSLGYEDGDLSNDRAKALDHYHGRPYGNEIDGRSQVVSRDLAEAVDGAMPAIMKVFVQSGAIAEFDPVGEEDEQLAQQESDYLNQVLMKDNAGFMVLHDAIKDTLLLRNGYVKHWWAVEDKVSNEGYTGLTMDEITQMLGKLEADGAEVEITGQESRLIEMPGMPQPPMAGQPPMPSQPMQVEVFDIKLKVKKKCGKVRVEAVPCEEVRVSKRCRGSLQDSPFTEHVTKKTRSDLIEMGMPRDFVDSLPSSTDDDNNTERRARDSVIDESDSLGGPSVLDRSMDEVEFCEAYIKVDYDGDGVAELRKVVTVADKIPPGEDWNEEIAAVPMTGYVAKRVPHRHIGESLDDDLADLQEILTVLKRQLLDNIYLTNNSQFAVNERVNLKDMLTSTPGGVKRVKGEAPIGDSISPLVTRSIIGEVLPVIQHYKQEKEDRSGISRAGQGLDPDVLREATKGAYMENLNRLSQKIEMMTRLLAEGVKETVLQMHSLLIRHQDKPRKVQLRGKWTTINPQEWKERTDLTVRVGLGTGNEEDKKQKLLLVSQLQDRLGPHGLVGPEEMYALFEDVVEALGFDMPEKYALTPGSEGYQKLQEMRNSKPDPEAAKAQAQIQIEQIKSQAKSQFEAMQLQQQGQLEQARMSMQAEVDRNRQEVEAMQQQAKMTAERELGQFKAQLQSQLEQQKLAMQQQTQLAIARINAESKIDVAQLTAQTTLSAQQEAASDGAVGA